MYGFASNRPYMFGAVDQPKLTGPEWSRAIPKRNDDADCFKTIRFWLGHCAKNHDQCPKPSGIRRLPSRVIDLGTHPGDVPKLYITNGEQQPYTILSHCWGGDIACKLTSALLSDYQGRGLPMEKMPQNFLDAIRVTRELGLRYVWIDSLCIIQDSTSDWGAEASQMAN